MSSDEPQPAIELSAPESWALLRQSAVGRLAVIVDDRPEIFPVNYLVDHGTVVLRTALGTKFTGAVGHWIAFEADGYDPETGSAWSVVIKGEAQEVNRLYDVLEAIELPLVPWHSTPKAHFVRIEPHTITGRRFEVTDNARSAVPVEGPSAKASAAKVRALKASALEQRALEEPSV
jgi:nitroimidazol reductase NimA-like FMN-containing flavoprotein (pyridoxamine 5'-phosphate oxidase superfamily)